MNDTDLYTILGIHRDATINQIKSSYRRLALQHHPDKGGDAEMFKRISVAYQILSNHDLKEKYDKSLPIPDVDLIPPLKVFNDCFNHWLKQYPLAELIFKDSCHDVIKLLNNNTNDPTIQLVIESMTGSSHRQTRNELLTTYAILCGGLIAKYMSSKE